MAFEWTEDISLKARLFAAGMNEVQDNIDTLYTALGLTRPGCVSGAGWTLFPLTDAVDHILTTQPQQLRDAIDYAYENMCPAYNNGHLLGYDGTYNPGYLGDDHGTYENGDLAGYDSTYNSGYRSGDDKTNWPAYLLGVDSDYYIGYQGSHYVLV